jgi:glycine betaine/choline ABC-type transport system substrate-binding protein
MTWTINRRRFVVGSAAALSAAAAAGRVAHAADEAIKVGWPQETEPAMLGCMAALIMERKLGLKVQRVANLGGTGIAQQALIAGSIDVLPDYTGDALANVFKMKPISDPMKAFEAVRDAAKQRDKVAWLAPTRFNNTYALALKEAPARSMNIKTISDLAPHAPGWTLGSSVEFAARPLDGYPGMAKHYGFKFGTVKPMDIGLMYTAIDSDAVNVIVAFATDARIGKLNLTVLDDDKLFFPAYNAAITMREELLQKHPDIKPAIEAVTNTLDTATQTRLNGRADIDGIDVAKVAEDYLKEKKFID